MMFKVALLVAVLSFAVVFAVDKPHKDREGPPPPRGEQNLALANSQEGGRFPGMGSQGGPPEVGLPGGGAGAGIGGNAGFGIGAEAGGSVGGRADNGPFGG